MRADLGKIGRVEGRLSDTIMGALRDAVGPKGHLMALTFTSNFPWFRIQPEGAFRKDTPPNTGSLAKLFLSQPDVVRSRHPTNSMAVIGPQAAEILKNHGPESSCFEPMSELVNRNGKQILIGCSESSPGFTTVHWCQHELGLDTRSLLSGKVGALYEDETGSLKKYIRRDIGGCSMGFAKFYADYQNQKALRSGQVGKALSLAIDAAAALAIERAQIKNNPRYALCDNPSCMFCRGTWFYNKRDWPAYYLRFAPRLLGKVFAKKTSS